MPQRTQNQRPRIASWFERHPGEIATKERIADDLGLTPRQVQRAIALMANTVTVVARGHAWRYDGTPPAARAAESARDMTPVTTTAKQATVVDTRALYEQVGVDGKGVPIVKGEDGRMWRLMPL